MRLTRAQLQPVTLALLAINTAVFLVAEAHGSTTKAATLLRFGAVEPHHVWAGEYWRLATYMFLHIGWAHFLWNSYASFGWCVSVERELGHARFLVVYLLSGLAGGAASTVTDYAVSAGASGAMFGIVGATLALRRRQLPSFAAAWTDPPTRATLVNIGIWTVIGLTAMPMNNRAHAGGLVAGALATWSFVGPVPLRPRLWAAYTVLFASLLVAATRPWLHGTQAALPAGPDEAAMDAALAAHQAACEKATESESGYLAPCYAAEIVMPDYVGDTTRDLEPACDGGDQDACAAWGWSIAHGRPGVARDERRGAALLQDACTKGSAWACALARGASPLAPIPPRASAP
jgi:membrane associated rhomboid family serine protease